MPELKSNGGAADPGAVATSRRKRSPKFIVSVVTAALAVSTAAGWGIWELSQRRTVPDLVGQSPEEARGLAKNLDLRLDATGSGLEKRLRNGNIRIASQRPVAGSAVRAGEVVEVALVGRGVEVPNLTGLSQEEAEEAVDEAQLELSTKYESRRTPAAWKVDRQSVAPGRTVEAGATVEIGFSVPKLVMPNSVGAASDAAETALIGLGLEPELVGSGPYVASMSIKAGTLLEPFTVVQLTTGYKVPNVVGKTYEEAKEALADFSEPQFEGSNSRPILKQSAPPGTVVAATTRITLTSAPDETVYRVIGNGSSAAVTWARPGGFSIEQDTAAMLPWEKKFRGSTGSANFNAQSLDGDSITCQVERNGKVVQERTSTGAYAVVQC